MCFAGALECGPFPTSLEQLGDNAGLRIFVSFLQHPAECAGLLFFKVKLSDKIGRVSFNSVSKKLLEFDSDIFPCFKDHFLSSRLLMSWLMACD